MGGAPAVSDVNRCPLAIAAQLRESADYLSDVGWRQTADLMVAAAQEIEDLRRKVADRANIPTPLTGSQTPNRTKSGSARRAFSAPRMPKRR